MTSSAVQCHICSSDSLPLATALVLGNHHVHYYSCKNCGFIQTEDPYWLEQAYSSAIARSDIGLIGRNIKFASFCSALIPLFYNPNAVCLDYGGGNGMFVRLMRDKGFNFYWHDKYALNQYANGFEAGKDMQFSLLTSFEVFEHLPRPLETIEDMFQYCNTVIFSTRLLPRWRITPDEWWYFTPDTGQHLSLYSRESLEFIAQKFNVQFSSNGISLHVFSTRKVPEVILKALSFYPLSAALAGLLNLGRKSFLEQDYYQLTGRRLRR